MSKIGSLVLVKSEYTDQSGWKLRPGLVTGEYLNDYIVTYISKEVDKYRGEPTSIVIDNSALSAGRLKVRSVIRSHKTAWAEKSLCRRIGTFKKEIVDNVLRLQSKFSVNQYYNFTHKPPIPERF